MNGLLLFSARFGHAHGFGHVYSYGYRYSYGHGGGWGDWIAHTVVSSIIHAMIFRVVFQAMHRLSLGEAVLLVVVVIGLLMLWGRSRDRRGW